MAKSGVQFICTLIVNKVSFAKFIGGALGWAMGGPIGGLLGFALGYIVDDQSFKGAQNSQGRQRTQSGTGYEQYRHHTQPGDFASALLVLSAAVMKADQRLMRSELQYITDFYRRQFGEVAAAQQIGILKELLKKDIPLREVCEQIRHFMELPLRLQLMHYLFGIAKADGNVDRLEVQVIHTISNYLGISEKDFE
ncbi:MAG: TerB family tellurite resistance protein, partial [Flavobacteriales bacterium]|nr:TerB family tellurite resistance protein [Flavobacteriales bacterium]